VESLSIGSTTFCDIDLPDGGVMFRFRRVPRGLRGCKAGSMLDRLYEEYCCTEESDLRDKRKQRNCLKWSIVILVLVYCLSGNMLLD